MPEPIDQSDLLEQIVDFVVPSRPPYETSVYLYLLRRSRLIGQPGVQVGKRTIGEGPGKGTRSGHGNYQHITEKLTNLAREGFIAIGETDRSGTTYLVSLPAEVPVVRERMATLAPAAATVNHYRDPELRDELFERDEWKCRYCGEGLSRETASLDHIHPVSKGGNDDPDNLAACCLMCNSLKSGTTYAEAAPQILERLRRTRTA